MVKAERAFWRVGYLNLKKLFLSLILITLWPSKTNLAPSPNINLNGAPGTGSRFGLFRLLANLEENSLIFTGSGATALNTPLYFLSLIAFIINASAIGYYGTSLSNEFTEDSTNGEDFLAKLCKNWEEEALKKPFFTRLVIFRIGIVLGKDGGALGKMLPIFKLGLGGPIGNGNQWMSWIHRDDLCELIINAIKDKKYNGIFNAVAPEPVKMREFSSKLASSLKRPNLLPVPGAPLRLMLGDGAKLVLEGQRVISIRLKNNFFKFKYPTLQNALAALTKN